MGNHTQDYNTTQALELMAAGRKVMLDWEEKLKELEKMVAPPVVQEIVLSRRHLEDSRMRLRVGQALLEGDDE